MQQMSENCGLTKLIEYRTQIENILTEIDTVMKINFPEEYSVAYQHWIPQIKTALRNDTKWLPRGEYSMDYTLDRIIDKLNSSVDKGVTKYIK